jgi:hypothetical protein
MVWHKLDNKTLETLKYICPFNNQKILENVDDIWDSQSELLIASV